MFLGVIQELTLPLLARLWTRTAGGVAGGPEGWKAGGLRSRMRVRRGGTGRTSCSITRGKPRRRPLEPLLPRLRQGEAHTKRTRQSLE